MYSCAILCMAFCDYSWRLEIRIEPFCANSNFRKILNFRRTRFCYEQNDKIITKLWSCCIISCMDDLSQSHLANKSNWHTKNVCWIRRCFILLNVIECDRFYRKWQIRTIREILHILYYIGIVHFGLNVHKQRVHLIECVWWIEYAFSSPV